MSPRRARPAAAISVTSPALGGPADLDSGGRPDVETIRDVPAKLVHRVSRVGVCDRDVVRQRDPPAGVDARASRSRSPRRTRRRGTGCPAPTSRGGWRRRRCRRRRPPAGAADRWAWRVARPARERCNGPRRRTRRRGRRPNAAPGVPTLRRDRRPREARGRGRAAHAGRGAARPAPASRRPLPTMRANALFRVRPCPNSPAGMSSITSAAAAKRSRVPSAEPESATTSSSSGTPTWRSSAARKSAASAPALNVGTTTETGTSIGCRGVPARLSFRCAGGWAGRLLLGVSSFCGAARGVLVLRERLRGDEIRGCASER